MHRTAGRNTTRSGEWLAAALNRYFLWLLLTCYVLAALWPAPGLAIRNWQTVWTFAGEAPLVPLLLLALLLFSAALMTDVTQIRAVLQRPGMLGASLIAIWIGPALLVLAAGAVIPWAVDGQATAGLLVGLALVAAMPVANSSVGWVQHAHGNLALALALVVLSISLCPWLTPLLIKLLGSSLSPREQAYCQALVGQFSGFFFIIWVVLPTIAGFACRFVVSHRRIAAASGWISLASAAALLLLNYINSALALPRVNEAPRRLIVATAVLAVGLSTVGLATGWLLARIMRLDRDARTSLLFGLSMKHTGLALILAGAVLAQQPLAILIIVLATLVQHILAGIVQWWLVWIDAGRGRESFATGSD
jgi:bile acid:Na+ symporter, BASS family